MLLLEYWGENIGTLPSTHRKGAQPCQSYLWKEKNQNQIWFPNKFYKGHEYIGTPILTMYWLIVDDTEISNQEKERKGNEPEKLRHPLCKQSNSLISERFGVPMSSIWVDLVYHIRVEFYHFIIIVKVTNKQNKTCKDVHGIGSNLIPNLKQCQVTSEFHSV